MIFSEGFQALFKSKEAKEAEAAAKKKEAVELEVSATVEYLTGKILLHKYKEILQSTFPLTRINLRRVGSKLK